MNNMNKTFLELDIYEGLSYDEKKLIFNIIDKCEEIIIQNNVITDKQKEIYLLWKEGNAQVEIATKLNLTQPTVSRQLNIAINKVNNCLKYVYYGARSVIDNNVI